MSIRWRISERFAQITVRLEFQRVGTWYFATLRAEISASCLTSPILYLGSAICGLLLVNTKQQRWCARCVHIMRIQVFPFEIKSLYHYRIFKPKTRWIMIQWSFVIFRNLSGWKNRLSTFLDNVSDSSWKVFELIDVLTHQGRKMSLFF